MTKFASKPGTGLYLCIAGQIHVKYANSKLKTEPTRAVCCPLLL